MRIESSIITSLSELRAIEQQRIAEERAAIDRERTSALESARAAELARVTAEQERLRAEREERMRIETTRLEAEREVRMRLEAEQNAERMRLAATLDAQRLADEMELRRAEVAKKRPTWMLVVTGIAAVAAVALTVFAIDRSNDMEHARAQQQVAVNEKTQATLELKATQERLAALQTDIDKLDADITRLLKQIEGAQTEADRKRLSIELAAADQRKRDAKARLAAEDLIKAKKKRGEIIDVSKCVGTALGCLEHK